MIWRTSVWRCLVVATVLATDGGGLAADTDMTLLYQMTGSGFSGFGRALGQVGDVDGDGTGDVVVGTGYGSPGVDMYSGANGRPLATFLYPVQPWYFGWSVGGAGDMDGVGEVIIGSIEEEPDSSWIFWNSGRVYIFNPLTGELVRTLEPPDPQQRARFGWAVSGAGDVNGDGVADLVVGTPYIDLGGMEEVGKAYVMSGADCSLIRALVSPAAEYFGLFGSAVCAGADLDGDGVGEIVVGAPAEDASGEEMDAGAAYVFSGLTGQPIQSLQSPSAEPSGRFGSALTVLDDIDVDGVADLGIGAPWEDPGESPPCAGRAYLVSGVTGALLHSLSSPNEEENGRFGTSVSRTDDIDGDGIGDVIVGAPWEEGEGEECETGRAYVFSGATGELVCTLQSPNPSRVGHFGETVLGLVRDEGDGAPIVLVGAPQEPDGDGRVYAFAGMTGAIPHDVHSDRLVIQPVQTPTQGTHVDLSMFVPRNDVVTIRVYNLLGRRVDMVYGGPLPAGWHTLRWDAGTGGGRDVAAGPYVVLARSRLSGSAVTLAIVE